MAGAAVSAIASLNSGLLASMASKPKTLASQLRSAIGKAFSVYPRRAILFTEGQSAKGVWLIGSGHVRITRSSAFGRQMTCGVARSNELLGLSAAIVAKPLRVSAQTIDLCEVAFIDRVQLMAFLRSQEMCLMAAETLSNELHEAYDDMGQLLLSRSSKERIARILLSGNIDHVKSHQQLAELAGCSRETVTRFVGRLQADRVIAYESNSFKLLDREGIEAYLG